MAKIKRKVEQTSDVAPKKVKQDSKGGADNVSEAVTKPKEKRKKPRDESNTVVGEPAVAYTVGGLSGLFGKSSSAETTAAPVALGESKITPKEKVVEKNVEREQQRENRKKVKKMTEDEKERTIFVGNMPLSADEKMVKKLFSEFGKVESVRVRGLIPTKETLTKRIAHMTQEYNEKQNSLIFYVKFAEKESVEKALQKNSEVVDGHRIRVDTVLKTGYDKDHTIFVGNLPFTVTEDQISAFFEKLIGPVVFSRLMKDKETGKGRGIAFVVFKDTASIDLALNMTGCDYEGRSLRISKMLKKKQIAKQMDAVKKQKKRQSKEEEPGRMSKINKYKFSTRKSSENEPKKNKLKKTAKKAIAKKKSGGGKKSLMK